MVRFNTKTLMRVTCATPKIAASAISTAAPPTASGSPAAIAEPNTKSNTIAASGKLINSLRRRSLSETL